MSALLRSFYHEYRKSYFLEFSAIYLYKAAQNTHTETLLGVCFPACPFHPKIESKLKISLAFLVLNFGSCS